MFDLLKLIAKKEDLQIALEGVTFQTKPNYRDNTNCATCSNQCRNSCRACCADTCDTGNKNSLLHCRGLLMLELLR